MPLEAVVAEQVRLFKEANETTIHFGPYNATSLKSLRRHIATATGKIASVSDAEAEGATVSLKKLQMIESSIKIWNAWQNKANGAQALTKFDTAWRSLMTFLSGEPAITLECPFMWTLFLTVRSSEPGSIADELAVSKLQEHFPDTPSTELPALQLRYLRLSVSNILSSGDDTTTVVERLQRHVAALVDKKDNFRSEHVGMLEALNLLLLTPARTEDAAAVAKLEEVLKQLDAPALAGSSDELVMLLKRFKVGGQHVASGWCVCAAN